MRSTASPRYANSYSSAGVRIARSASRTAQTTTRPLVIGRAVLVTMGPILSNAILWVAAIASASTLILGCLWRAAARDRDSARASSEASRRDADEARRVAVESREARAVAERAKSAADKRHRDAEKKLERVKTEIDKARNDPDELARLWSDTFKQ